MQRKQDLDDELLEARIRELEIRKLDVKQRIEDTLSEIAKESGIKSLKNRKYDVGFAPNDWSEEENLF